MDRASSATRYGGILLLEVLLHQLRDLAKCPSGTLPFWDWFILMVWPGAQRHDAKNALGASSIPVLGPVAGWSLGVQGGCCRPEHAGPRGAESPRLSHCQARGMAMIEPPSSGLWTRGASQRLGAPLKRRDPRGARDSECRVKAQLADHLAQAGSAKINRSCGSPSRPRAEPGAMSTTSTGMGLGLSTPASPAPQWPCQGPSGTEPRRPRLALGGHRRAAG